MKRRQFILQFTLSTAGLLLASAAKADADAMRQAIRKVTGGAIVRPGKVSLEVPSLVDNGNTVPLLVRVDSPMSAQDHVRAIHVFNEKNPQPNIASFRLGPQCGRAAVSTRVRLADSQQIVAICEMSDGSYWSAAADVVVTLAACLEVI
jgi:sulfur-oxidizing protein SoxY